MPFLAFLGVVEVFPIVARNGSLLALFGYTKKPCGDCTGVYEIVVGKQGKKEYPHLEKSPDQRGDSTSGNE